MDTPRAIGKYEILDRLGSGGMAEVFLARQVGAAGFEKRVAIKCLSSHHVSDPALSRSLINEARLTAQLSHPNLVQIFDFAQIDNEYYLAMEYIEGTTLEHLLNRCCEASLQLPRGLMIYLATEVLTGLEYAHSATTHDGIPHSLVHRDIKPSNIMISSRGLVKVMDFGIAKANTNLFQTSTTGGAKGTLAYMSPEQLSSESLTATSDLFSFGLVLYEMATLEPFFADTNIIRLARDLYLGLRPSPRARLDISFPELVPIVERLLQPAPEDRFPDARSLLLALRPLTQGVGAHEMALFLREVQPIIEGQGQAAETISYVPYGITASDIPGTSAYEGSLDPAQVRDTATIVQAEGSKTSDAEAALIQSSSKREDRPEFTNRADCSVPSADDEDYRAKGLVPAEENMSRGSEISSHPAQPLTPTSVGSVDETHASPLNVDPAPRSAPAGSHSRTIIAAVSVMVILLTALAATRMYEPSGSKNLSSSGTMAGLIRSNNERENSAARGLDGAARGTTSSLVSSEKVAGLSAGATGQGAAENTQPEEVRKGVDDERPSAQSKPERTVQVPNHMPAGGDRSRLETPQSSRDGMVHSAVSPVQIAPSMRAEDSARPRGLKPSPKLEPVAHDASGPSGAHDEMTTNSPAKSAGSSHEASATQPAPARVTIEVVPGADIYLDGKYIGRTPIRNYAVTPGNHQLRCVNTSLGIDFSESKTVSAESRGRVVVPPWTYDITPIDNR